MQHDDQPIETSEAEARPYQTAQPCCADPRPDCMGMLVEGIGNRCRAMEQPGAACAQAPLSDLERAELLSLRELVNNPITADFVAGVQAEAAHQVQRWGGAHDRSKSAENWFWLVGYLAGKCLRACVTGDRDKALHHTISAGAALANWHAAILADTSGAGVGVDADLTPLAGSPQRRGE